MYFAGSKPEDLSLYPNLTCFLTCLLRERKSHELHTAKAERGKRRTPVKTRLPSTPT